MIKRHGTKITIHNIVFKEEKQIAVTWEVNSTKGLGTGWKDLVKSEAKNHGYGSLYYAKRLADINGGDMHCWTIRTKKTLGGKYEFTLYSHKDIRFGSEVGSGYGPDVKKL